MPSVQDLAEKLSRLTALRQEGEWLAQVFSYRAAMIPHTPSVLYSPRLESNDASRLAEMAGRGWGIL